MTDAQKEIQTEAQKSGNIVEVLVRSVDISDRTAVVALWDDLEEQGIAVDVLVLNAARLSTDHGFGPILENTVDDIWSSYETNVLGLLSMIARLEKQNVDKYKVSSSLRLAMSKRD